MALDKITLGRNGELEAERLLKKNGFKIIEKNYRCRCGEIDIIAKEKETLVFVEVKTRANAAFGPPISAVDAKKQRHMLSAAEDYLTRHDIVDCAVRFDVVSVEVKNGRLEAELLKNAFEVKEW